MELFQFSSSLNYHPVNQFDEQWIKESILGCCKLFLEKDVLQMDKTLENELLHKVWPFTYKLYEQGIIAAKLGSNASTFASRDDRSLDVKIDTLYKFGQVELGCSAVAEVDVSLMDGEYLDDWFLKLSKAPRDMLCLQVAKNPAKMNHLRTFGLIVIGK